MNTLLSVRDLVVRYPRGFGRSPLEVLHRVSLDVHPGKTLGLVGESGSGKTTTGRAVLGLAPVASGSIRFDGEEIANASPRRRRALAREIQVIFQDPYSSLNPAITVGSSLAEPLLAQGMRRAKAQARIRELLDAVALPSDAAHRYPREFSGGQRQRVAIARALAVSPRLIICDEPVSALDLSTQATVLELLKDVQARTGVAYLFVSHDLAVVRYMADEIAVMRSGEIVETGDSVDIVRRPQHPYSRRLLAASLVADPDVQAFRRAARLQLATQRA